MFQFKVKKIGIDTYRENVAYLSIECDIANRQRLAALSRVEIHNSHKKLLATVNRTQNNLVTSGEIGLSNIAFERLGLREGDFVTVSHSSPLPSIDLIRKKLEGCPLSRKDFFEITRDILNYNYSNIELTAFVIACSQQRLNEEEVFFLTEAMVETGKKIDWNLPYVLDKHCIGGIPGNRTTMIVVPIIAALGLPIPKTSSRAITSSAGTADTMECLANVQLSLEEMKQIIAEEKGCITWGGSLDLAPVDDIIISVERPLGLDSEGQMVASILSKKKAAGSTHVLIDVPVGSTAKIRFSEDAERLKKLFEKVGEKIGLKVKVIYSDGNQPVGRGIGPFLECQDVLHVLENRPNGPIDLKEKSLLLASQLLTLTGLFSESEAVIRTKEILESGQALQKFWKIIEKQGKHNQLRSAYHSTHFPSPFSGIIQSIHNLKIAKVAKLAGAPDDKAAGVFLLFKKGDFVEKGKPLFRIDSDYQEKLELALRFSETNNEIIKIG